MNALTRFFRAPWTFWIALLLITWALSTWSFPLYKALDARWIIRFPAQLQVPLDVWLTAFFKWLQNDADLFLFTFRDLTRFLSSLIEWPYDQVRALMADGFESGQGSNAVEIAPPLSWIAVIFILIALGRYARDWWLAALVGGCFVYLAVFGQWDSAMVTLSSVIIAVPIGVALGLGLGILTYRSPWFDRLIRPLLDLMQTVPVFAYLVPVLVLFGFGPVAALIATLIYATPPTLMVGVNQVIMLTLNMVIIASMIGAGGLGFDVLSALRRLDIGGGIEAGVAIVVMAIALDRLSQAFVRRPPSAILPADLGTLRRHPWLVTTLVVVVVTYLLGLFLPAVQSYPAALTLTTGTFWSDAMEWININYFDTFEAVKSFFLTVLLLPVKRFFSGIPWAWGIIAMGLAAWRVGGWRLGLMAALMTTFIAASGFWAKAMITIYLCGVSVLIAYAIGVPLGIWAGQNTRVNSVVGAIMDTLQTLPSFVYLIPVVMLFRVGDFSAMIAIVLYALAPAVRYAAHGIRSIDPQMIEAGLVSGCTPRQLLWRVKLPLAAPSLLLGLNQTIMLALSMLVITALVGTRDLGQEVYIALTKADTGHGIVAGLCVAFIAIIADRILTALSKSSKQRVEAA